MSAYLGASYRIVSKRINDFLVTNFLVFLVGYVSIVYEARLFMFKFKVWINCYFLCSGTFYVSSGRLSAVIWVVPRKHCEICGRRSPDFVKILVVSYISSVLFASKMSHQVDTKFWLCERCQVTVTLVLAKKYSAKRTLRIQNMIVLSVSLF